MNDGTEIIKVSFRLADGRYFPLFRYGHLGTRNLLLAPAQEKQDEVALQFFHHPADGSNPNPLGTLRIPNLPRKGERELKLHAFISETGNLLVKVSHEGERSTQKLEVNIPSEKHPLSSSKPQSSIRSKSRLYWIFGILFLAVCLALITWMAFFVANKKTLEPAPAPLSTITPHTLVKRT